MPIQIGKLIGLPGRAVTGEWDIATNDDGHVFSLSCSIHSGLKGDLRVLLASGPEYPSALAEKVLSNIAEIINPAKISGTLITIHNFASRMAELKGSDKPLYPGWPSGNFGDRIAFSIMDELMKTVDYAIFLEGPEPGMTSIPHGAMYSIEQPPTMTCHPELIKMMGHDLLQEKEGRIGSLAIEIQREFALPSMIAQLDDTDGDYETEMWLKEKIINFLSYVEMVRFRPLMPDKTFIVTRDCEIRSERDGFLELEGNLGQFVAEGDLLGVIKGETENDRTEILNPINGYIVRRRNSGNVTVDDLICSILEVRFSPVNPGAIYCTTAINNCQLDVEFRPNVLFHGLAEK